MDLPTIVSVGPEIWGRPFWEFLDAIIATYAKDNPSDEQRDAVAGVMNGLRYVLPCPECRAHYNTFLSRHPIENALGSRKSLIEYYFLLKQDVANSKKQNFMFKSPDDLWQFMLRRMKLIEQTPPPQLPLPQPQNNRVVRSIRSHHHPSHSQPQNPTGTQQRRASIRSANAPPINKGCGCGKR